MKQIDFYGDKLDVVDMNGQPGVAARRLVENLGLSWSRQAEKLADPMFRCAHMCTVGGDDKNREMMVLPVKSLPAYLFSINPKKVREDLQERLAIYRLECVDVLYNYWAKGYAINPRPTVEDSLEGYVNGTGKAHLDFLNNILDAKAVSAEQRDLTVEILKIMLRDALSAEEVDIEHNLVMKRGVWECMAPAEITLTQTIESEAGLYFAKEGLPETVEHTVALASKIGFNVTRRLHRTIARAEAFSRQFEESIFDLIKGTGKL